MFVSSSLQQGLSRMPSWVIALYAALCSFGVYFCMYAFRKPFTAAGYEGMSFLDIDYKVWLVTAQVSGYTLSKFYGIKFISSVKGDKRSGYILKLIAVAWIALLPFAIVPAPYNIIFLLVNGFPLGMVWGLVFSYIEGRKATEFMGAILCTSFIFSSGIVKSAGKSIVLNWQVSEMWMPFIAGGLFVAPLIFFVWLLNLIPKPDAEDVASRSERKPMTDNERTAFVAMFFPGILIIVTTYILLTILRDFRDNFANELWTELGLGSDASIFTVTEIPVSIIVLLSMSLLVLVKNNIKAFIINHYIIAAGYLLAGLATLLFSAGYLTPIIWMTIVGTGLYLSYVPFNSLYFDRMIASYKATGNVGFIMYIADSFGYLGSVLILFVKQFVGLELSWTAFFIKIILIISSVGIIGTMMAAIYFKRKYAAQVQKPGFLCTISQPL